MSMTPWTQVSEHDAWLDGRIYSLPGHVSHSLDRRLSILVGEWPDTGCHWSIRFDGRSVAFGMGPGRVADAKQAAMEALKIHREPWATYYGLYQHPEFTGRSKTIAASHTIALDGLPRELEVIATASPFGTVTLQCKISDNFTLTVEVFQSRISIYTPSAKIRILDEVNPARAAIEWIGAALALYKSNVPKRDPAFDLVVHTGAPHLESKE